MAIPNSIHAIKELTRQIQNKDDFFIKKFVYFFELKIPSKLASANLGDTSFLFPLVLPPQSYTLEEPFTLEATPTQGGGLYVEENGIVQRTIRLSGTTGWKPRALPMKRNSMPPLVPDAERSHSRKLQSWWAGELSGQRHFQYLQDTVFRTYADLKRNPETALDTQLCFHNPKDQEHWWVAPQRFTLQRDSANPLTYRYDIELLVLGPASEVKADFSEDQNWFDKVKDVVGLVKQSLDFVRGAIQDLTAMINEVRLFIQGIDQIFDSINIILDAAEDFVNGTTALIQVPYAFLGTTIESLERGLSLQNAAEELNEETQETLNFPEIARQKLRQAQDGLERMGQIPERWARGHDTVMEEVRKYQEMRRRVSAERREEAKTATSPSTFADLRSWGTKLTPGEELAIDGEIVIGSEVLKFRSARSVVVSQGDSLMSLAAQYLGDARAWQYIATMNGLQPPFIDAQASAPLVGACSDASQFSGSATGADESPFPKALGIGSRILIPSNQVSIKDTPVLPVLGVGLEEDADSHLLGTDFLLEAVKGTSGERGAIYDVPVDLELGAVDAKTISGKDNLAQAVMQRLVTDKGADTLYRNVGIQRVVGLGFTPVDMETARFRVIESVIADPRISGVQSVEFEQAEDAFLIELTVAVRGSSESFMLQASY